VEETASFLQSLLASHGPNYLEKLFGSKARDALAPLGGVEKVAIALSGKSKPQSLTRGHGGKAPHTAVKFQTRRRVRDGLLRAERHSYNDAMLQDLPLDLECPWTSTTCNRSAFLRLVNNVQKSAFLGLLLETTQDILCNI
jgi:hypothetical protein